MNSPKIPKYPCRCCIIPEVMVKMMKKEGYDVEMPNVQLDESIRLRRQSMSFLARAMPATAGHADRDVFDSQNTASTRMKLIRTEGNIVSDDADINAVYENGGIVRDYFKTVLDWNSIDNNGLDLVFNVHYLVKYNNAFWDGEQMTFGDGDGTNFKGFVHALDVIAHELTHGVVQYTAALEYKGQSGALNEHYADAFGSAIKQWSLKQTAQTADWLMGEVCLTGQFKGKAIRSMKSPADPAVVIMPQPETMAKIYKGTQDNGGVHINSGILNKAFYLVSMDIGTQKAAVLWFETLKTLKSTSKFTDFYKGLSKVSKTLITAGKIPNTTQKSLDTAFKTVGIIK